MAAELTLAAIAVLLISAAFSALLLRLGLQRQIKLFETFDAAIVDFERDTWRGAAGRPVVPAEDDDGGDLHGLLATSARSEERRVGKECGGTCRSRGSP